MPSLVHQIGELFLRAVPVAVIVLIFYLVLKVLFFGPLLRVMAERDARTRGAQKEAEAAQATAAEKMKQYEDSLRQAKSKLYAEMEAARQKLADERAEFLKNARSKASADVNSAKDRVAAEAEDAKKDLATTVPQLSDEIAGRVLQPSSSPTNPGQSR
jgi:F-type H+-transporting ATPase subunit b